MIWTALWCFRRILLDCGIPGDSYSGSGAFTYGNISVVDYDSRTAWTQGGPAKSGRKMPARLQSVPVLSIP
ncbi:MAG: hypothetical protein ACP5O1_08405 [Phycisphaerae bacterium]